MTETGKRPPRAEAAVSFVKARPRALLAALTAALGAAAMVSATSKAEPYATITTSKGDIVVELDAGKAPVTTENFLQYAADGHYDRTLMHRVVAGFVIQGGGYSRLYTERPTRPAIKYEGDNGLKNVRGTIAMARQRSPESASAQWYINLKDNPDLDHRVTDLGPDFGYAVFGRVVSGMDVADAIGAVPTGPGGPFASEAPLDPVIIERVDQVAAP